jgi:signal peptidase II
MMDLNDRSLPSDEQRQEVDLGAEAAGKLTEAPYDEAAGIATEARAGEVGAHPIAELTPVVGASLWQRLLPLAIASIVLILDQYTKYLVETRVPLYQSWAPIPALAPFFRITHTSNTGAAFGLFQGGGWIFGVLAAVVAVAIIYYSLTLPGGYIMLRLALGLQLGGALGNLLDRIQLGHVTDFLDFGPWPVFNLADFSVVSGVVLLAWLMLRDERQARRREPHESDSEYPPSANRWRDASNERSTRMRTD